jgi:hypothetical protein
LDLWTLIHEEVVLIISHNVWRPEIPRLFVSKELVIYATMSFLSAASLLLGCSSRLSSWREWLEYSEWILFHCGHVVDIQSAWKGWKKETFVLLIGREQRCTRAVHLIDHLLPGASRLLYKKWELKDLHVLSVSDGQAYLRLSYDSDGSQLRVTARDLGELSAGQSSPCWTMNKRMEYCSSPKGSPSCQQDGSIGIYTADHQTRIGQRWMNTNFRITKTDFEAVPACLLSALWKGKAASNT